MSDEDREKWNARYRGGSHMSEAPSPFVVSLADELPRRGRALDLASGAGRNGLWLAERGLDVTLVDISQVALEEAKARARQLRVTTLERDLAEEGLPEGPWDVIVSVLYLERSLFAQLPDALAAGGVFVMLQPTVINLERHPKPPRPFLLEPGELERLVSPHLAIAYLEESWSDDGFHEARLLATKP